jgi:hypothetical protein
MNTGRKDMTTYYRGPDVLITDRFFAVLQPTPMQFRIAHLQDAHVVRGGVHPARTIAGCATGATAVVVAFSWPFLHSATSLALALLATAAPALATGACFRVTPRQYELRARYQQFDVRLYATTDLTRFGQVQRALLRALERRDGWP